MRTGPNIRKRTDGRFEARYIKGRSPDGRIKYGYVYASSYAEAEEKRSIALGVRQDGEVPPQRMQILILGCGDHGRTAAELCSELRIFSKISFLDDFIDGSEIVGKCADYVTFLREYPIAYPGFGDNDLRRLWFERLQSAGFIIPTLVHPTALIAPSAEIGEGTVVEARTTINSGVKIGKACIISTNTVIDVSAEMGDFAYTAPGITIPKRTVVAEMKSIESRPDESI